MIRYEIEEQFHATVMDGLEKLIEGRKIAKETVDSLKVGDIIAKVGHGTGIDRR